MTGRRGSKREQGMEGGDTVVGMSYMREFTKKKRTITEGEIWGAFHPPRALKSMLIPSNGELKLSAMFIFCKVPYWPGISHQRKATG